MTFDLHDRQSSESSLRHNRIILGVSAAVYILWWFAVEALLPGSFNPLFSRLLASGSFLLVLGLSYRWDFFRRHIDRFQALCAFLLTLHYFYLFDHNPNDVNWVVGSYITVVAVGLTLQGLYVLIVYSLLVLLATWFASADNPAASLAVPGIATILILLSIVEFIRNKAALEKQGRLQAEGERASAEAISAAKSLFLANMSHELRTPLTSIVGFSELLSDDEDLSPESKDCAARIRNNSYTLLETVNQILALTEDESARFPLKLEALNIRDLVEQQMRGIEAAAKRKELATSLRVEAPFHATIISDPNGLSRILGNVFGNAIKFTTKGSIVITLSTKPSTRPGWLTVTIQVRDSGIGIPSAEFERIFEPFRQASESYSRPFGGSGLGLTVARKIARAMDGDVSIAGSEMGRGTTVQIRFEAREAQGIDSSAIN